MDQEALVIFLLYGAGLVQSFHTIFEYYFVNSTMTWHAARQYCREHYTDLATFKNMDDIHRVTRPNTNSLTWIGLFDDPASWQGFMTDDSNSWRWSATGAPSPSRYMKWSASNPDYYSPEETCVSIIRGEWLDYPCNYELYFACFKGSNASSSKQFFLILTSMTWENARSYCRQHYTDLAMIENETENTAVAFPQWGKSVWIGLYREPWRWSDGSTSTFKNWAGAQPNGLNQSCVAETSTGDWHDVTCTNAFPFLCHKAVKTRFTNVQLKLQTGADLTDPANTALILAQLSEMLKKRGFTDFRMKWTLGPQNSTQKMTRAESHCMP